MKGSFWTELLEQKMKRTVRRRKVFLFKKVLLTLPFIIGITNLYSQCTVCPQLEMIMVDACPGGAEFENEFVVISSGSGFNSSNLQLDIPNNTTGGPNNDINLGGAPCGLQLGDNSLVTGCPNVIPVGPGFDIPSNSLVVLQISGNPNNPYDFSAMCGSGECVYVIRNSCIRSSGAFANSASSLSFELDQLLQEGMEVLIRVRPEFHERYGLKLQIEEIDPSYTLGKLELNRRQIIKALQQLQLLDKNKQYQLPLVLQNLAILSSPQAAGLQDFNTQLYENPYGYHFITTLFPIAVQGVQVEKELLTAMSPPLN